ncbi:MAG: UDP-N-acetylmuramate:L-alanyl-gamma-D-glutamyl-meso-diaminopimelate ligase, partial [Succinivibrio sp.]
MRIHILGICGTFMGGIAAIARQAGFEVTGADEHAYPPMSGELEALGIRLHRGYDAEQLDDRPDLIVVGNVMKRGMPVIERMLNEGLPYVSGPQWLEEHYLKGRSVMAVAGTHGKTTTSSMLAWILEEAGLNPGFLIGGMPGNFKVSARSTQSPWFVIEADEYDCAFFDKRSKFVHYHPRVLAINNIEYDHADIFANVGEIERQFHHLVRTVPSEGLIAAPARDANVDAALAMGCWTPVVRVGEGGALRGRPLEPDCSRFEVIEDGREACEVSFACTGDYSMHNALMAMACARYAGVSLDESARALSSFRLPRRRMELKGVADGVEVYDDFAHHPTAVRVTLHGLRQKAGPSCRIVAVFEPRSNSMKMGANA